jgi:hypothetical protein
VSGDRGQSTVEYVVVLVLVLGVLAGGALALGGAGIAAALVAQVERALCLVTGDGCAVGDRAPCVVASRTSATDVTARLAVLRLRGGRTLTRETLADGRERLTLLMRGGAGLGVALGLRAGVGRGTAGATAGAEVEGRLARGRVWVVRDRAAGDDLLRRLTPRSTGGRVPAPRPQALGPPPPPDAVLSERGLDTVAEARLGRAGLTLDAEDVLGARTDRRSGERTLSIRRRNDLGLSLGLLGPAGAEGLGRHEERYALVVDRGGRPLALEVRETLRAHAGPRLPKPLRAILARTGLPLRGGRVWETERRLDLADPANLAAAGAFVRALRAPRLRLGDAVVVGAALRDRLDAAALAQARVYALTARTTSVEGAVDAGPGVGGGYAHVDERLRLLGARMRGPDGVWRARADCLLA